MKTPLIELIQQARKLHFQHVRIESPELGDDDIFITVINASEDGPADFWATRRTFGTGADRLPVKGTGLSHNAAEALYNSLSTVAIGFGCRFEDSGV
jgi:hypothetical protein